VAGSSINHFCCCGHVGRAVVNAVTLIRGGAVATGDITVRDEANTVKRLRVGDSQSTAETGDTVGAAAFCTALQHCGRWYCVSVLLI
jgi:hypothetical protein